MRYRICWKRQAGLGSCTGRYSTVGFFSVLEILSRKTEEYSIWFKRKTEEYSIWFKDFVIEYRKNAYVVCWWMVLNLSKFYANKGWVMMVICSSFKVILLQGHVRGTYWEAQSKICLEWEDIKLRNLRCIGRIWVCERAYMQRGKKGLVSDKLKILEKFPGHGRSY